MNPQTNSANTKDWLEAYKELRITAYIEHYTTTLGLRARPLPSQDFDALRKISVPVSPMKQFAVVPPQLNREFQAWDALSDEALTNLERELG